jgi:PBP1b-binding outer membrane lipoprotein LpoB
MKKSIIVLSLLLGLFLVGCGSSGKSPSAGKAVTPTPSPTATPDANPTATPSPTPDSNGTATPTATPTPIGSGAYLP